jgi:hypothetical protein
MTRQLDTAPMATTMAAGDDDNKVKQKPRV